MSSYLYQILGGILIFLSSLVSESMSPAWKKRSYIIFGLLALAYVGVGILLDRHASTEQGKLQASVSSLKGSFDLSEQGRRSEREAAEKVRQSDRDAFLKQLKVLEEQLSAVRANVQTESLRKQLDDTQRSILQTSKLWRSEK
jgi:hypothetical protein